MAKRRRRRVQLGSGVRVHREELARLDVHARAQLTAAGSAGTDHSCGTMFMRLMSSMAAVARLKQEQLHLGLPSDPAGYETELRGLMREFEGSCISARPLPPERLLTMKEMP